MQIVATQIRVGMILNVDGDLYRVNKTQHVTPGKGVACMQTKLKNIINGKNLEKRFRSADRVERISVVSKKMQYLHNRRVRRSEVQNAGKYELKSDAVPR